ncbi:MAG: ATP-binding protein [Alphaproteobacteria bacterium]|nr:ATP-binding protein [Alphaproteobacteria bacterium]
MLHSTAFPLSPAGSMSAIYSAPLTASPPSPYFFSEPTKKTLACFRSPHHSVFIETKNETSLPPALLNMPDFFVLLLTPSTYHLPVAQKLSAALMKRFLLPHEMMIPLETCLQEALLNAVIHGNLAVDSRFQTLSGFESFCSLIETRLAKAPYCNRRITISAWCDTGHLTLCVADEGDGFRFHKGLPEDGMPHGRGMYLIRSLASDVWIGDDRRSLFMTFTHENNICTPSAQ